MPEPIRVAEILKLLEAATSDQLPWWGCVDNIYPAGSSVPIVRSLPPARLDAIVEAVNTWRQLAEAAGELRGTVEGRHAKDCDVFKRAFWPNGLCTCWVGAALSRFDSLVDYGGPTDDRPSTT